jgi:hypothetical protein
MILGLDAIAKIDHVTFILDDQDCVATCRLFADFIAETVGH